jgi:hypothetical protein
MGQQPPPPRTFAFAAAERMVEPTSYANQVERTADLALRAGQRPPGPSG